ncbi:hypothetical protein FRC19_001358 [Serendipita sp. 401]|nr:hypothetical protein FRC19_001358 [Serendipita sp. 401]
MDAEAGLRVAYFALNLTGGFFILIIAVMLTVERRRCKQGAWFAAFTVILSRLTSVIVSCLLLFSGAIDKNSTSGAVCIAQSGLHTALPPLLSYTTLSYILITALLVCRYSPVKHIIAFQTGKVVLLALPFIIFAVIAVISSLLAEDTPSRVKTSIFYCYLDNISLNRFSVISSICALIISIALIGLIAPMTRNKRVDLHGVAPALLCWAVYSAAWTGLLFTQCFKTFMAADVLSAADGIIVSIFLAIQRPTIIACVGGLEQLEAVERAGDAIEDTTTTPQPIINVSATVDVSVSPPRQDLSPAAKMRALSIALGLAPSESELQRRHSGEETRPPKSPGFIAHPYATENKQPSFSSLKSIQYGMALGHPSRDVSRNVTPAFINASSEEAVERSMEIILPDLASTPSPAEKIQMDDLNGQGYGRASRLLATLRVHGSTPSIIESALASTMDDKSSPRSRPASAFRQHPLPSSIFLDNRSQAPTPASAFHPSPYLLRRILTPSRPHTSSEMHSDYSHPSEPVTGTESSGRILAESIEDSVLSWPDLSGTGSPNPNQVPALGSTSDHGTLGYRFPISTSHQSSIENSTEYVPPPSLARESSPSPLRLDDGYPSVASTTPRDRPGIHVVESNPDPIRQSKLHTNSET